MRTEAAGRWPAPALGAVLLCWSAGSHGLVDTRPFGRLGYELDDNVYRFAGEDEAMAQRGSPALEDTVRRLTAGTWIDAAYGRQSLLLYGALEQYRYNEFAELDRTENEIESRFEWAFGIPWTGHLAYDRSRKLEPLTSRDAVEPGFQRQQEAELFVGYALTPRWQVQGTAGERRKRLTRPEARHSDLDESRARLGFAYASAVAIAGAAIELTEGRFPNRTPQPGIDATYDQTDFLLQARNDFSGVSSFETEFGYTIRTSPSGADGFRGLTGLLRYEWRWMAKAVVDAKVFRRLRDVEERDANYVEELGTAIVVRRPITTMISAVAQVERSTQDFRGSPALASDGAPREDGVTRAELGFAYEPRPWINVKPLVRHERRTSNRDGREYGFTAAGLTVEVRAD